MLIGLLILRRHGGGTFGLSRVLWKQVRWRFSLPSFFKFANHVFIFPFRKAVIWLALAIVTEIPPLVNQATLSVLPVLLIFSPRRRCSWCWT